MNKIILCVIGLVIASCASHDATFSGAADPANEQLPFVSSSGVDENRARIAGLPDADVWLNVTGEHMGWLHRNVNMVFPTVNVYREGPVRPLAYRLMDEMAQHPVKSKWGNMPFRDLLDNEASTVMGLVILHRGEIVFEHYPRQQHYEKPIYWSVAKVFASTLVGIFEDRGLIDVERPVSEYISELEGTPFGPIRIRNILDMATGLDCPENYSDPNSCYYAYSQAVGEGYFTEESPDNPYTYVAGLDIGSFTEQGTSFQYTGINTFVLAWLLEKVSGMPYQDLFTKEIWSKIGAEADGAFLAPRYGVPNTSGGFMSRMRDLARFGLLFTPSYHVVSDEKIVSDRLISTIRDDGNPELLRNARGGPEADPLSNGVSHNAYQWDEIFDNHDFFKGGWGGQGLLVNPDQDLVAVYAGYTKADYSQLNLLPVLRTVLKEVFPDYSESR